MKYFISIFLLFFLVIQPNFAEDTCDTSTQNREHFYIEVEDNVNVRNMPCTTDSDILRVAQTWEIFHVVAQKNDFYKVVNQYGSYQWIWSQAVQKTDISLWNNEKKKAEDFVNLLENLLEKQGKEINLEFINSLKKLVNSYNISQKETLLFDEIFHILHLKVSPADSSVEEEDEQEEEEIPEDNSELPTQNEDNSDSSVDSYRINKTQAAKFWLDLNNDERESRGLYEYTFNDTLNQSAQTWSDYQKSISFATHKRDDNDMYYDYQKITKWLADESVVCKNIDKYTHTENVGWGAYYCDAQDCTAELQNAMTRTFDFYMSEEFDNYQPHFLSIVNEYFTEIWVWVAIKETKPNYFEFYSTIHYCTQVQ